MEDSWRNLLQKLMNGELDLLSDVSYTRERTEHMLYSALAMGSESYYLYIDADNTVITPENLNSLNGKRIGVNKGSYQVGLLRKWAEQNDLSVTIVELTNDEAYFMTMLASGEIDALVSMDNLGAEKRVVPVSKIGSSDYYFAVSKHRPDLLSELNSALSAIQDEDPFYNQKLTEEYVNLLRTNAFITAGQESWLDAHGAIRVGYWDNYLPFCATDKKTGELTGALKDYLTQASNCLKNADVRFEAVPYPTTDEALSAMKAGEIDCVFPVNLSSYDGEEKGVLTISPIMRGEMSLLMRSEEPEKRLGGEDKVVVIDEGNTNFETFVKDSIPAWTIKTCPTMEDCFRAVRNGTGDGVLACTYRMNVYEPMRIKYKLIAVPIGETMELTFAVNADDHTLYSILNKIVNLTPEEDMQYALSGYLYSNRKISLIDFLEDNWMGVLLFITAIFAAILFLLNKKLNAERRVNEQQKQMEESLRRELEQKKRLESVTQVAYTDALTGVKSKHAYAQWEAKINEKIDRGEQEPFAVVVCDINDLKMVNDIFGHKEGDACIRKAAARICGVFSNSPVFRMGGDEFMAILSGEDYERRAALMERMNAVPKDHAQIKIGDIVSAGMVEYRKGQHHSVQSVCEAADAAMYRRKLYLKGVYLPENPQEEGRQEPPAKACEKYEYSPETRETLEGMKVPFAVYQFIDRHVVTLIVSDGFCDLLGYKNREKVYFDMDHHMYKDTHPDDVERVSQEAFRFATQGGAYNVTYRSKVPGESQYRTIHAIGTHVMMDTGVQLAQVWYTDEGVCDPSEDETVSDAARRADEDHAGK